MNTNPVRSSGKRLTVLACGLVAFFGLNVSAERQGPWIREKTWGWYDSQPWIRGCNYMSASCANRVDQWQAYGSEARFTEMDAEDKAKVKAKGEVECGGSVRSRIAKHCKVVGEDMWQGYRRTKFDFNGHAAWVVEPSVPPAKGVPWTWTMQWAEAFVDRTGVPDLLRRGYHHVTIDLFDTRMNDAGLANAAAFQKFLVDELGFAPKARLIGMSWGGFFSTRYAAAHPENVAKIYLDAPLLNFDGFGPADSKRIGVWADVRPISGRWSDDPRMPVNMTEKIAAAKIPILLLYGGADTVVPPTINCKLFAERFQKAGGELQTITRGLFGHHPHGLDPDKTDPIVDFFMDDVQRVK